MGFSDPFYHLNRTVTLNEINSKGNTKHNKDEHAINFNLCMYPAKKNGD